MNAYKLLGIGRLTPTLYQDSQPILVKEPVTQEFDWFQQTNSGTAFFEERSSLPKETTVNQKTADSADQRPSLIESFERQIQSFEENGIEFQEGFISEERKEELQNQKKVLAAAANPPFKKWVTGGVILVTGGLLLYHAITKRKDG